PLDGIDPSFFFDDDGRTYIVHNGKPPGDKALYNGHRAIWLWAFDPKTHSVSNGRIIVNGGAKLADKPVWIEGPHLFKRNGFYYLCAAEGGTSVNHSQVVFRTKSLDEPFVPFEGNPILTQRDQHGQRPDPVTSVGHAQLVDTPAGDWWAVFLGVRPYERNLYNTGRETFLLPVTWADEWPVILKKGEPLPRLVKRPALPASQAPTPPTTGSFTWRDEFDGKELGMDWSFLRTPRERWWSLTAKPGSLLVAPRPVALNSVSEKNLELNGNPSFIARRQQHMDFSAVTTLVVNAATMPSESGLAALQNDASYFFLGVKVEGGKPREIFLERHVKSSQAVIARALLAADSESVDLKIEGAGKDYRFSYRPAHADAWIMLIDKVDGSILSTETAGGFVGTMIGVYSRLPIENAPQAQR
ncbi:MAG TPA: family 43 glycosylhydrolase, partial [Tepidisphaeraceae bacterium]|nr:family 43 glycosylhydrolase [Tepidisphaeraceae bacterium]